MSIDTRARRASQAVRTRTAPPAPDFSAFLRHAAAARRRRVAVVVSLVIAALLGIGLPLSGVYQDYRKLTPTQQDERGEVVTPSPPASQPLSQGLEERTVTGSKAAGGTPGSAGERQGETEPAAVTGGRIFYASSEGGAADGIWVMNGDGSGRHRLAEGHKPNPSPDGRRVAFVRENTECSVGATAKFCSEIWLMDDDGSNQRRLGSGDSPDWAPDGRRIAFTRPKTNDAGEPDSWRGHVYVMNDDGSQVRLLYGGEVHPGYRPRWSPDGTRMAVVTAPTPEDPEWGGFYCTSIYVMEVDGPGSIGWLNQGCYTAAPSWSPDGSQIAFHSSRGTNTLDIGIYVATPDGSDVKRLTPEWEGSEPQAATSPSWSPGGSRIAYTFDPDGDMGLGYNLFCRKVGPMYGTGRAPRGTDCRPPGPTPGDVYVMNADGSDPSRLVQGHLPEFSS